jgi:cystathionine gamma-synthase/cystathionine beta-lyase
MKTLSVRLDRQQQNAQTLAEWLERHPLVGRVYYPGLTGHAGHELLKRQGKGFGAMIAFEVKDPSLVEPLLLGTELISFAESLGGVETLITFPEVQTHADIEPEKRQKLGINNRLLRLSVGIEDVSDLIADLELAFEIEEAA